MPHPQDTMGQNSFVLTSMKIMYVFYGIHSQQISTQLNTYGRF